MARGLVLFVAGLMISGFTIRRGIEPFDEGLTLQAARRVAAGQMPYSDFLWPYGPAHVYLLAGTFKAFGVSLLWWRIVRIVVDAAVALVVFALVRRAAPLPVALVAWLVTACAMAQPTGANPFAPALLFALLAVLVASGPPSRRRWIAAGTLCALAAAWRIDFGAYAALGAVVAAVFATARAGVSDAPRRTALRAGAIVAASCAALTALVYLPFVIADGPARAWQDLIGRSLREGGYWRLPFPIAYDGPLRAWPPGASLAQDAKHLLGFYIPLLLVVGLAVALATVVLRRARPVPEVAGLAALAVGFVAYLLSRTDEFHSTPLIVALAALIALLALRAPRPAAVAMLAVLTALLAYGASNRLSALFHGPELSAVNLPVADGTRTPPAEARAIEHMVAAVHRRVPPGAPIYTVTLRSDLVRINDPMIYVLTQRDNPARQDFGLQTSARAQDQIVAMLERIPVAVIVRWTDPISTVREPNARGTPSGVHTLDRWLASHYRLAERHGSYEILVRR
jgi:hypothetical protein